MKIKFNALALIATVIAAPAFAAAGGDFDSSVNFADITAISMDAVAAEATAALADTYAAGTGVFAQNVALIGQLGDSNFAVISQETGVGNFASVMQDSTNGPQIAVVSQNGSFNRAFVTQK